MAIHHHTRYMVHRRWTLKTLSDPGHWEKKCWIMMYDKKFLLLTDFGTNDEITLKMGVRKPSPVNPAVRNQNVQENSII